LESAGAAVFTAVNTAAGESAWQTLAARKLAGFKEAVVAALANAGARIAAQNALEARDAHRAALTHGLADLVLVLVVAAVALKLLHTTRALVPGRAGQTVAVVLGACCKRPRTKVNLGIWGNHDFAFIEHNFLRGSHRILLDGDGGVDGHSVRKTRKACRQLQAKASP
jgi:hypothetical protein